MSLNEGGYFKHNAETTGEDGVQIIDEASQFLISGPMDAHAHVQSMDGLANMMAHGVTTV